MATNVNLYIDQGMTYASRIVVLYRNGDPVDLTGCQIQVVFRKSVSSSIAYSFNVQAEDAAHGTLLFTMSAEDTARLQPGHYVFDGVYTVASGDRYLFIKGVVRVSPRVTR